MRTNSDRQREDDCPVSSRYPPADGDRIRGKDNHRCADNDTRYKSDPETLDDLGYFEPEVRALDFLLGGAPGDIV